MDRELERNQRQVPVSNGFRWLWPPNYPSTSPDQYERAFNFGGDVSLDSLGTWKLLPFETPNEFLSEIPQMESLRLVPVAPMDSILNLQQSDKLSKHNPRLVPGSWPDTPSEPILELLTVTDF